MLLEINIGNFGSYFALFAGLNLGYASSQSFRDAIDNGILKIGEKTVNAKIANLLSRYSALVQTARQNHKEYDTITKKTIANKKSIIIDEKELPKNNSAPHNLNKKNLNVRASRAAVIKSNGHIEAEKNLAEINNLYSEFQKAISVLDLERESAANFVEGFKSMFLITTFYCMTFLVLAGLQNKQYDCYYNNVYNFLAVFIIPFNIYIFLRSNGQSFDKKIKPTFIAAIFFSIILLTVLFNILPVSITVGKYFSLEFCMPFACLVAISPYVLHFIRAARHRNFFKPKEEELINKNKKAVADWDKIFEKNKNLLDAEKQVFDWHNKIR